MITKRLVVHGIGAVPGVVEGIVRVVSSSEDISAFREGEVFVSFTGSPESVASMEKAAAIITDVGGTKKSTVHPAIVARELGIPCIVRTRIGSKRLKTGDRVLVDATKGNVYLIDKVLSPL